MQILPALAERDLARFGEGITELQGRIGAYFAPVQGGPIASRAVAVALERAAGLGAAGVGQSSWGPTGFAFTASADEADRLAAALARVADLRILITRGRNRGATVEALDSAAAPSNRPPGTLQRA
jgi:beta-ribofuranosylaminobenzene 5'-phosphate synthase